MSSRAALLTLGFEGYGMNLGFLWTSLALLGLECRLGLDGDMHVLLRLAYRLYAGSWGNSLVCLFRMEGALEVLAFLNDFFGD